MIASFLMYKLTDKPHILIKSSQAVSLLKYWQRPLESNPTSLSGHLTYTDEPCSPCSNHAEPTYAADQ